MHKITKDEAKEFFKKQNYEIILSTKLSNYTIDDNDYDTIYFPISKQEFIKEIQEEEIIWNSEGEIQGYMEDWEEELENIIQMSEETELEFYNFCKERDIDFREWIDESIIPNKPLICTGREDYMNLNGIKEKSLILSKQAIMRLKNYGEK